eukprot:GFYU01007569.1.p1 GENE.GFYU01007569.1~~GFYU01007569.1.p1  ORF type:complete len:1236 (-),score=497.10 GFYU01007569.1:78-3731(-)
MGPDAPAIEHDVFSSVRAHANAKNSTENRKQANFVLDAIADVLRDAKLPFSPTSYFGALMNFITKHKDDENVLSGVMLLLSLLMPKLPPQVMQSKVEQCATAFMGVLQQHYEVVMVVKPTIHCLGQLLKAQDASQWGKQKTTVPKLFQVLQSFTNDARPKIRKQAQQEVSTVVHNSNASLTGSGAAMPASVTANYCVAQLQQSSATELSSILHTLGLMKSIADQFTDKMLDTVQPTLRNLLTMKQANVTPMVLSVVHGIFNGQNVDVSGETIDTLMDMIFDYSPNTDDHDAVVKFLSCVHAGMIMLKSADAPRCGRRLQRVIVGTIGCLEADREDTRTSVGGKLRGIVQDTLDDEIAQSKETMKKICEAFEVGLTYRYQAAWDQILPAISTAFTAAGASCFPAFAPLVKSMGQLHDMDHFPYEKEVNAALTAAVTAIGPRHFLSVLPLGFESATSEPPRTWLFEILNAGIRYTELSFFGEYFLPLATDFKEKVTILADAGAVVEAKNVEMLAVACLQTFPGFCILPVDIASAFPRLAKTVANMIKTMPEVRQEMLIGLAQLIERNKNVAGLNPSKEPIPDPRSPLTPEGANKNLEVLGKFAQNYLPILFNLQSEIDPSKAQPLIDCIAAYASIAPAQTVNSLFKTVVRKMLDLQTNTDAMTDGDDPEAELVQLTSLALGLVNTLDDESVALLYRVVKPNCENSATALQKKSYKIMVELCHNNTQFVTSNLEDLSEFLVTSILTANPGVKKARLKCLQGMVMNLPIEGLMKMLPAVIGEIMLCTKEINSQTREAAYDLIVCIAIKTMQADDEANGNQYVTEVATTMAAGMAAKTPHMISAAIVSLSRLLFEASDHLEHLTEDIFKNVLVVLGHSSREIQKSALGCVKVVVRIFSGEALKPHLQATIEALLRCSEESRNRFRLKVKMIIERLVRKCGYEDVEAVFPEEHKKLLVNMRKIKEREKKAKAKRLQDKAEAVAAGEDLKSRQKRNSQYEKLMGSDDEGDDEEEDDDEAYVSGRSQKMADSEKQKLKQGATWIRSDESMDLLNPTLGSEKPGSSSGAGAAGSRKRKVSRNDDVTFDEEMGTIVVKDEDGGAGGAKMMDEDDLEMDMNSDDEFLRPGHVKSANSRSSKRMRVKSTDGKDATTEKMTGAHYKSRKADGDIKKKGDKFEPYAYMPMDRNVLNKRKKTKATKGFGNLIKSAQKGAKAGTSSRKGGSRR